MKRWKEGILKVMTTREMEPADIETSRNGVCGWQGGLIRIKHTTATADGVTSTTVAAIFIHHTQGRMQLE
jgi:hypothetical protein